MIKALLIRLDRLLHHKVLHNDLIISDPGKLAREVIPLIRAELRRQIRREGGNPGAI